MVRRLRASIIRTLDDESGAVTVDWVVLCAAVIGMGMIVLVPVATGTETMSGTVGTAIGNISAGYGN